MEGIKAADRDAGQRWEELNHERCPDPGSTAAEMDHSRGVLLTALEALERRGIRMVVAVDVAVALVVIVAAAVTASRVVGKGG